MDTSGAYTIKGIVRAPECLSTKLPGARWRMRGYRMRHVANDNDARGASGTPRRLFLPLLALLMIAPGCLLGGPQWPEISLIVLFLSGMAVSAGLSERNRRADAAVDAKLARLAEILASRGRRSTEPLPTV